MIAMQSLMLALPVLCPLAVAARKEDASWVIGLAQLHRLDLLPALKLTIGIGGVSSYDRTGGNDDGFSGKYSFVRKEGDDLVLADIEGPGCIYRIHTPTPTDDPLEFYFDGETRPRIATTFNKLYAGETAPFVRPLVDYAGGGYTCYVPLPFKKSCKILVRAKEFHFYDLNYALYPKDAPVKTFNPKLSDKDKLDIERATAVFNSDRAQDLTAYNVPAGTQLHKHGFDAILHAGKAVTLFQTNTPARIASLRMGPAEAFGGKARDILLRISWDGDKKPAVCCPAGDFFGYAWGAPATGSALVGTCGTENYCNFPMPFDKSAKIELVSLREGGPPVAIRGEVVLGDAPRKADEGKFYAVWRRENPTTEGRPFTFLETKGRGHIVGLALQAQGKDPGSTPFFEGDDQTTVDGKLVVHGTGSEDFFNGGWYDVPGRWNGPVARALSGCMLYQKSLGRSGGYRFFIGDAYSYRTSILQTIEHAPERNEGIADYCSVTYLYSEKRPTADFEVPSKELRTVVDPKRVVFPAHWGIPIASFSFDEATISRRAVPAGDGQVRCLSMRAKGQDWFGPPFIAFTCRLPAAGKYRAYMDAVKGPEQGVVQLFRNESPTGKAIDLYAEKPAQVDGIFLGEFVASEGDNEVMFKIVGKNPAGLLLGFDLVNIVFEK